MTEIKLSEPNLDKVCFENAKVAKELGFPQNIFNVGWYNDLGRYHGRSDVDKNNNDLHQQLMSDKITREYYENNKRELFLAPSHELLHTWLRDNYGLYICIVPGSYYFWLTAATQTKFLTKLGLKYFTYKEAFDDGLNKAMRYLLGESIKSEGIISFR